MKCSTIEVSENVVRHSRRVSLGAKINKIVPNKEEVHNDGRNHGRDGTCPQPSSHQGTKGGVRSRSAEVDEESQPWQEDQGGASQCQTQDEMRGGQVPRKLGRKGLQRDVFASAAQNQPHGEDWQCKLWRCDQQLRDFVQLRRSSTSPAGNWLHGRCYADGIASGCGVAKGL